MTAPFPSHPVARFAPCPRPQARFHVTVLAVLAALLGAVAWPAAAEEGGTIAKPSAAAEPIGYAFAKASPLTVYDSPDMGVGRKVDFEFAVPYAVSEQRNSHVQISAPDGRTAYVRLAHVAVVRSPSWAVSTPTFRSGRRNMIRLFESATDLGYILGGTDGAVSRYDFTEYFDDPPDFSIRLPILDVDTIDVLGEDNPRTIASVMVPISAAMHEAFGRIKEDTAADGLDIHFLVDASGSTSGFLAPVLADIATAIGRDPSLSESLSRMTVTAFAAPPRGGSSAPARHLGAVSVKGLSEADMLPAAPDRPTDGDIEPLVAGVARLRASMGPAAGVKTAVVVLSGADVDLGPRPPAEAGMMDLGLPGDSIAIFGQVTPEPGDALEAASKAIAGVGRIRYLPFSDGLGKQVADELDDFAGGGKVASIDASSLGPLIDAAHDQGMIAFLPNDLNTESELPKPQAYAADADWYTLRLWLTLDGLILEEAFE